MLERLRRRLTRRRTATAADVVADLRSAIVRLDDQRRLVAETAGRTLVTRAEVTRACSEQLQALHRAARVAASAETAADSAARSARGDAPSDPASGLAADEYDRTATALRSSQDVLTAAAAPIRALLDDARRNAEQARELLATARATLDAQLREQVRLLREVERLETRRQVELLRRRSG